MTDLNLPMMKSKIGQVVLHTIGCLMFLALPIIFSPDYARGLGTILTNPQGQREFFAFLLMILFFYFHHYVLIPKLFFQHKYMVYGGAVLLCLLFVYGTPKLFLIQNRPESPHAHIDNRHPPQRFGMPPPQYKPHPPSQSEHPEKLDRSRWFEISQILAMFCAVLFVSLAIRLNNQWRQVEKEKLNTELSYLRAQVNPHFLFNTLNSIYALAIEKSDETAEAITKLSSMMRYVLSETNKPFISLEKEINYISDYIELQKLRLGDTIKLKYTVLGKPNGKQIAPLILMTFIENAFKHGVNPEENSTILIEIDMRTNELILTVDNKKVTANRTDLQYQGGLGIVNTRSRLQLLYPSKHELTIADEETDYLICLKIKLSNG